jgi:AbrB family looped-hinge helix DNA binding protein
MAIARISEKGQLTLPAKARRQLGIKPKSRVEIEVRNEEIVIRPARSIRDVIGIFRGCANGKSDDWETIRTMTERKIAEEVANEDR